MKRRTRKEIRTSILIPTAMASREKGEELFDLIDQRHPILTPEKYGYYEPLRSLYKESDRDELLSEWGLPFFYKSKLKKFQGSVFFSRPNRRGLTNNDLSHDKLIFDFHFSKFDLIKMDLLIVDLEELYDVDIASMILPPRPEEDGIESYEDEYKGFDLVLTTRRLRKCLPTLPWRIYFGKPYIEMFGREKILSTPAFKVEEVGGLIAVQLCESPELIRTDYSKFKELQDIAKEHLGPRAFFCKGATDYITPVFDVQRK